MPKQDRAGLSAVPHELASVHVPLAQRGLTEVSAVQIEETVIHAHDAREAFPSLVPASKPVMVQKSYRMPLDLVDRVAAICKRHGIREEASLIRDFIKSGVSRIEMEEQKTGG